MNIPGLVYWLLNEDGVTPLEGEDGENLGVDTPTTQYNIKYLFDGFPVTGTMNIPDAITDPEDITEYARLSIVAYYAGLEEWEQPENIFSVQAYLTPQAPPQNPDYNAPGWPYDYEEKIY